MAAPVLDIATFVTAAQIRIDGELYALKPPDALSLLQVKRLEIEAPALGRLMAMDAPTPNDEQEMARLLGSICQIVLDAPADVHARLTDAQRLAVMNAFIQLRSSKNQPAGATVRSRIGATASRGSNGSTAATKTRGSRASR